MSYVKWLVCKWKLSTWRLKFRAAYYMCWLIVAMLCFVYSFCNTPQCMFSFVNPCITLVCNITLHSQCWMQKCTEVGTTAFVYSYVTCSEVFFLAKLALFCVRFACSVQNMLFLLHVGKKYQVILSLFIRNWNSEGASYCS